MLEVPEEAVELYRAAPNWKNFADIRAIGSTTVQRITDTKEIIVNGSTVQIREANNVAIFSIDGRLVFSGAECSVTLSSGVYVISADGQTLRVLMP